MKDSHKIIALSAVLAGLCLLFLLPNLTADNYAFFLSQRLPRVAAIILTGGAIALSAVLFQTVTNNRILTPATLGFDALYLFIQAGIFFSAGATSLLVLNSNINFVVSAALMIIPALLLLKIVMGSGRTDLIFIVLVGTIFGQLFRTLAYFLLMIMSPSEFTGLQNKLFASFNNINISIIFLSAGLCILAFLYIIRDLRKFDIIALGREHAISLGVDHDKLVKKTFVVSAIMVSAATALVGPIAFLGLLTANLAREMTRTFRHSIVVAIAVLLSAVMLMGSHIIVERFVNFNTTVTVLINFIGGVYFIILLLKENKL